MQNLMRFLIAFHLSARARLTDREEGASMVEYGLLVALIAVVVMIALTPLGEAVADLFTDVTGELGTASS